VRKTTNIKFGRLTETLSKEENFTSKVRQLWLSRSAARLVRENYLSAVVGRNIREIANKAGSFISAHSGPVFLIGWSRGAAACIQVAHNLARSGRKVEAMFLFDAVDQDLSTNSDLNFIPSSVKNGYHAIAIKKVGWKN